MCVLVINSDRKINIDFEEIIQKFPMIKTIVLNLNNKNTNVVLGKENIVVFGNGYIEDKLEEYTFKISPNSFYQVNPIQTEKMYKEAVKEAKLKKTDILCDLYCGIGTIGIFASKYVKKVYGIEIIEDAINDAKENARINKIDNIEFILGDVEYSFSKLINSNIIPNVVIVDPPRKGLDNKTIDNINKLKLERIVYVSCNPSTLVRDLQMLEDTYKIEKIIPIDNFCYSTHVESIAVLNIK